MTPANLRKLLDAPQSWERDQKIKAYQNRFIAKSGISRRLFDSLFRRCTNKKKPIIERRTDLMDKKQ